MGQALKVLMVGAGYPPQQPDPGVTCARRVCVCGGVYVRQRGHRYPYHLTALRTFLDNDMILVEIYLSLRLLCINISLNF